MLTAGEGLSAERDDKTILQKETGTDSGLGLESKTESQRERQSTREKEKRIQ